MNVKLLRKVKKHILAEPKRLNMWSYILRKDHDKDEQYLDRPWPRCGTAACVAGWTCILAGDNPDTVRELVDDIHEIAAGHLALDVSQAYRLFMPEEWPAKFGGGCKDDGKSRTSKIAAARIEHFIKTKGAR